MEVRFQPSNDNRRKQVVSFTIQYSNYDPVAVSNFTKALDSLNQLYSFYIKRQLKSEEFRTIARENNLREENIGKFYIDDIRQGSIIGILSDPHTWFAAVGFVGSIASIISLFRSGKRDEIKTYIKQNRFNIVNINNIYNLIQLPKDDYQTLTISDGNDSIVIRHEDKELLEEHLSTIVHYRDFIYRAKYIHVWVLLEKINGEYFANIINDPMLKQTRIPIEFRDRNLEFEIQRSLHINSVDLVFLVDIDIKMYGSSPYGIIIDIYKKENIFNRLGF